VLLSAWCGGVALGAARGLGRVFSARRTGDFFVAAAKERIPCPAPLRENCFSSRGDEFPAPRGTKLRLRFDPRRSKPREVMLLAARGRHLRGVERGREDGVSSRRSKPQLLLF